MVSDGNTTPINDLAPLPRLATIPPRTDTLSLDAPRDAIALLHSDFHYKETDMAMNTSGEIDVRATPAAIIATIVDFATYPEWSSAHKKAVVEETDAQGRPSRVRMTVSMVGISDEQVVDYTFDGDERVSWSLVESTQQRSQEGSYVLTPTADGTHLAFELAVDLKIPVPGFLLNKAKKSALETATKGLKKRVESLH